MTTDIWNGNGNWSSTPGDWSLDTAPTASDDVVIASGTDTLSTAGVANVIAVSSNATFNFGSGGSLTAAGISNNGQINFITNGGDGGEAISISGTFTNYWNTNFVLGNSSLSAATTMTVGQLANSGAISLWGNENVAAAKQVTLDVKSAAPSELTGSIYLHGDADLEFASGAITAIANGVEFQIDGQQSRVSIGAGDDGFRADDPVDEPRNLRSRRQLEHGPRRGVDQHDGRPIQWWGARRRRLWRGRRERDDHRRDADQYGKRGHRQ